MASADTAEGPAPGFLLATERSGSNLLRSILNTHSAVTAPHPLETAYPWRKTRDPGRLSPRRQRTLIRDILINKHHSFQPLVDALSVDGIHRRFQALDDGSFMGLQQAIYGEYAARTDADMWLSKDPGVWDYLDDVWAHYPELRIVYLVRDARDSVLSFKRSNVGEYHPYYTAQRWRDEQARGRALLDGEHADAVHLIRYEDLLQEPESEIREVCDFLGLEFEEAMLYYYDTEDAQAASESASAFENLAVPIKSDNFGKFHDGLTDEELTVTEKLAGEELTAFGYDLVTDPERRTEYTFDEARYAEIERDRARSAQLRYWREDTEEQIRRYLTRSFSFYMILRYGLLA